MAQVLDSSQHALSLGRRQHVALTQHTSYSKSTRKHHRVNSSGTKFLSLSGSSGNTGSKKRNRPGPSDVSRSGVKPALAPAAAGADAENMASSFLQFCPICDKQLAAPSVAMLYCSERCRQQDTDSNQDHSDVSLLPLTFRRSSSLPSHTITAPDFAAMTTRVMPQREPSTLSSLDVTTPGASLGATQMGAAGGARGRRRQLSADDVRSTAATSFLAQFHSSPADMYTGHRHRASSGVVGVAHSAQEPALDHSSGSTPVESLFGSPHSLKRLGSGGSQGSLQSLAPSIQSPSGPEMSGSDGEGFEVGGKPVHAAVRDRNLERTLQGNAARESLIRMLGEA